jgi:hypothetical protein
MEKMSIHRSNVMEKFFHPIYQSIFSKREWRESHPSSQHEGEKIHPSIHSKVLFVSTCEAVGPQAASSTPIF